MPLLEFARGAGLAVALTLFTLGLGWRLWAVFSRPAAPRLSPPRVQSSSAIGAIRGIVRRMWHPPTLRRHSLPATINAYAYHVGLAIVAFGFLPHIAFIERLTGLSWPPVPGWLFATAVAAVFVGLVTALLMRVTSPVLRLISDVDDYASWALVMLPMATGMALIALPAGVPYPVIPERPVALALHLISLELLLAWLPFGKLSHAVLVFVSRGTTGAAFARKGAAP